MMFRPLTILFACAFAVSFAHADDATPAATADAAAPAAVEAAAPAADVAPAAEEVAPAVEAETEDVAAADNAGDLPVPDGVTHNVRLSRSVDGYLQVTAQELYNYATLAAPEQGTVKLGLKGQKVAEAQVGPGGVFQIPGLQDGRYSFVVNTPYGFGTFAHYVSGPLAGQRAGSGVVAGLVPPADYGFVRGLIMDNPSSGVDADGGAVLPAEVLANINAYSAFQIGADGMTEGYIVVPSASEVRAADHMTVWFVRDGRPVGDSHGETNATGLFRVGGLAPGYYTMVATGRYGFLAMGVEVELAGQSTATKLPYVDEETHLVWAPAGAAAAAPADSSFVRANLPMTPDQMANALPPMSTQPQMVGGGGGGAGGGGAGGGSGLLGALLGAAAGAGLYAALDDDDKIISPPGP